MKSWDYEKLIATVLFVASIAAEAQWPKIAWVAVIATTLNVLHLRYSQYFAGTTLKMRVKQAVTDDLSKFDARLTTIEKCVEDVRDAQNKIGAQFRNPGRL